MIKIFFSSLFFCCLMTANAQSTFKPGVKGGVNFATFTNSDADTKTDFYLGGLFAMKFSKFYTLQPELVYSRQGAIRTQDNTLVANPTIPDGTELKYSLDYLSLGVINKFTFGKGFHFDVGPSIDFKVGDNFNEKGASEPIGLDLALIGGIGYAFSNGFSIDARFKQGMADIFGNNYNNTSDPEGNGNIDDIILNQLFQVGVSYTFDIKK
ncbi:porin family protein [Flavobacterium sp. GT3R68]|uniref:porin family protein n=1 Tax=Flavobacterium sp. GT3R68 TaxID=2594437 RepID=UPI000F85CFB2|nr:porin family protein [Flavobacterium sp. GT3R68]RTY93936.1 PorT family protein [Flavobacterium sp. GSN2]TRW93450.1 PorT family protein [Flavobacterium sp. GT3R68]